MPGERPHHTEKMHSCVEKVTAQGHEESSAWAICTATMQNAGLPIFEGAESNSVEEFKLLSGITHDGDLIREIHLKAATGTPRLAMLDEREYVVIPVIALMEGVIHAVNADTPEFVPIATLTKAAASWNGRPATLGHPTRNGRQCSANDPEILSTHGIGTIFNSRIEGKRLLQEAWLDKKKLERLHPKMLQRLLANQSEEVSVGAFVVTDDKAGQYGGKKYNATWLEAFGDHLAFLPGGR